VLRLFGSKDWVRLGPLTAKVQLDARKGRPQAPSVEESLAWARLLRDRRAPGGLVRVRGPLVGSPPEAMPTLEVRDFWNFSPARPELRALWLGVEVNGPYGLGESWVLVREGLLGSGDWEWLAETADLESETFAARAPAGRWPDQAALERRLSALGAGASLRGVEAAIEGQVALEHSGLVLRARDGEEPIALAPLGRKIQRDGRRRSEAGKSAEERSAYERLRAIAGASGPRRARVLGPVVQSRHGRRWLLELRDFVVESAPGEPLPDLTAKRRADGPGLAPASAPDTAAPAPPRALSARFRDGQILLQWEANSEPDLDGYNVFRSTAPGGGYIQIAAGIVPNRAAFRAEDPGVRYHYVVTARDRSGNESGYSLEAAVDIPRPPSKP
jgi:hypothetical protein